MPLKANDYHNHLKLKTKAQICYFLLFLSVFFVKTIITPAVPNKKSSIRGRW